jgi:hypothetical protein
MAFQVSMKVANQMIKQYIEHGEEAKDHHWLPPRMMHRRQWHFRVYDTDIWRPAPVMPWSYVRQALRRTWRVNMPRDTLIIHECSQVEELAIPHTVPLHPVRSKQPEPKEEHSQVAKCLKS